MKTRNKIAIGLGFFYLLSVTGVALNLHFCSNELSSVHFTQKADCNTYKPANNQLLAKKDTRQKSTTAEAKCADGQETAAKKDADERFSVASFFTPVIGKFMEYLMPGLFFKIQY
ncbi:HYC_CC_PP family protein [Pedobacter immunditicola]|uniref:HYC_CC_PP family protein n=1 Tax=Pedobacter immunditicola TaxID=3133440 RepID=UPI003096ACFC